MSRVPTLRLSRGAASAVLTSLALGEGRRVPCVPAPRAETRVCGRCWVASAPWRASLAGPATLRPGLRTHLDSGPPEALARPALRFPAAPGPDPRGLYSRSHRPSGRCDTPGA